MGGWIDKVPTVYLLASRRNGVLYVGVTSDLAGRICVHRQGLNDGFTKRYGVHRLVYYEVHEGMKAAILRESRLKKWKRTWKVRLIENMNPEWADLYDDANGTIRDGPADVARAGRGEKWGQ